MSSLGFGTQGAAPIHCTRTGNGLLNALSANTRAAEARSPTTIGRPQDTRSPTDDDGRQKPSGYREDSLAPSVGDGASTRNPLGAIGNDPPTGKSKEEDKRRATEVQDPLEGMSQVDRFGLKGLRTLMNNYVDYNALTHGVDPQILGLNLNSNE